MRKASLKALPEFAVDCVFGSPTNSFAEALPLNVVAFGNRSLGGN